MHLALDVAPVALLYDLDEFGRQTDAGRLFLAFVDYAELSPAGHRTKKAIAVNDGRGSVALNKLLNPEIVKNF